MEATEDAAEEAGSIELLLLETIAAHQCIARKVWRGELYVLLA